MLNNFNVNIVRINGEDDFGIRILDEKYLNLVYRYDNLNVEGEVLSFEIKVLDNPDKISDEILNSDEFSDFTGQFLLELLKSQMEKEFINDNRESNTEEPS